MGTMQEGTPATGTGGRRVLWLVLGGCAVLLLCGLVAGVAGGAWLFTTRRETTLAEPAVEYILDASPRMTLPAEGADANVTRLAVAQGVLAEIVRPADPDVTAGLRVFGTGALPEACEDTELVVPLAPATQGQISDELLALQAGASANAAMAEAMVAAIRDLSATEGPHALVVVTGGQDSCNAEAGQLIAAEADRAGITLQLFVVGYQVPQEDAEAVKGMVEESGSGTYLDAFTEEELRRILEAIQAYVDNPTGAGLDRVNALATPGAPATAVALGPTPAPGEATAPAEATSPAEPTAVGQSATPVPAATTTGSGGEGPVAGYQAQTACDHPYFPLRQGATWTYQAEFGSYTWTVTEVTGDLSNASATMVMQFDEGSVTYHWNCSAEGVVSYDFGNFSVSSMEGDAVFNVLSTEGAWLLPADQMESGASWTHSYTIEYSGSTGDTSFSVTSNANQSFTAAGIESVSVPAGSFEALRVDGSGTFESSTSFGPGTTMDMSFTYWMAPGVGIVRSTSDGGGAASTTELVSYSIP